MEERVLKGNLAYQSSMPSAGGGGRTIRAAGNAPDAGGAGHCLRQPTGKGNLLVFPSYYRRERPDWRASGGARHLSVRRIPGRDLCHAGRPLHHTEVVPAGPTLAVRRRFQDENRKAAWLKLTRRARAWAKSRCISRRRSPWRRSYFLQIRPRAPAAAPPGRGAASALRLPEVRDAG